MSDFKNQFLDCYIPGQKNSKNAVKKNKKTFIVKPEGLSQGKGIFLTRKIEEIMASCENTNEGCVV